MKMNISISSSFLSEEYSFTQLDLADLLSHLYFTIAQIQYTQIHKYNFCIIVHSDIKTLFLGTNVQFEIEKRTTSVHAHDCGLAMNTY